MNLSISKFLFLAAFISSSWGFDCVDRYCSLNRNENNEVVFDCSLGASVSKSMVKCFNMTSSNKIILTTADETYIPVDKIAPGAFARLTSNIEVDKIYINKLQFKSLNKDDFDGLSNISEMRIENPTTLASDTFMNLATKKKNFILTISCIKGNSDNSFKSLFLLSSRWRLYTENCYKRLTCEYAECDAKLQGTLTKIRSSNMQTNGLYQLTFQSCSRNGSCLIDQPTTPLPPVAKQPVIRSEAKSPASTRVSKAPVTAEFKNDENYDSLMYVVLILTAVNSVVILGILVFMVVWWKKLSTSNTNNKHTIVLDDEDDSKYLNCKTYT